ncbi:FkbM family methyltransferase [Nocardiopsis sp. RSe5-2]|uniref:FkbM family methyltransferase n=1 Tax=Nocardiopsis endophytica TaxID=3018445 RepID=A0ABT4TWS1_9ACTN|nr:FkbM family methyltransferase [Nocardiopsis endophytica]MDA2809148.1 FkbM family methyltransferase [Nocardiopsis endophytica]
MPPNDTRGSTGDATGLRLGAIAGTLRACAAVSLSEPEIRGLAGLVRPGDVCFDIGAAYGMYTFPLAALVGESGAVHSFEPLPLPFRILDQGRRASGARHVHTHNAALGPKGGKQRLTLPYRFGLPIHGWAYLRSGLQRPGRPISFSSERVLDTEVHTVDEVVDRWGIGRVRFMKIDVEGFEQAVLAGAARTLERDRPALLLEVEDRHLDKYGTTSAEVADALAGHGYTMSAWRRGRWTRVPAVTTARRNYLFTAADSP